MLSSQESDEKIWAVGGYLENQNYYRASAHVQTIDLETGDVTLLSDMAFNRNITGGCTVMVEDRFLYIIGGSGIHEEDYEWTADVTRTGSCI